MTLLIFWSCNNSTPKDTNAKAPKEIQVKKHPIENISNQRITKKEPIKKIDIQSIKDCGKLGITSFNMDSISNPEKYIDNSLIENILGKTSVNEQKDWFLKANEWERFSCYQWEENQDYFLFTLLQSDESCCLSMYLCVTDKAGQLLTIRHLGLSGGDGGWFENDWGEKIEFGKFKLYYDSYYDEDQFKNGEDLGYTREHEYTELQISLEGNTFKIDTLNYTKTDTLIAKK